MDHSRAQQGPSAHAPAPPVRSEALQRGAQTFVDFLKHDPSIKQFVLQHRDTADQAVQTEESAKDDPKLLREELARTQSELARVKKELDDARLRLSIMY
ncbi:hypothetical protein PsYK624_158520 [Phanerochaete sordida]|uniref:Uncharacterized protein n=1 Tax=Phanerochaete sordida TaxID=48140 RepID=A0A9P3GTP0_9APHY|nr:hypothetical protein PsYK624_158520 [Phanerochaete sordida]